MDSPWNADVRNAIDRDLKLNRRDATPKTVQRQPRLLEYSPYLGVTQKFADIEVFRLTSYEPNFLALVLRISSY